MEEMLEIKKAVDSLRDENLKSYLGLALKQIRLLKEQKESTEGAVAVLIELYDQLMEYNEKKSVLGP